MSGQAIKRQKLVNGSISATQLPEAHKKLSFLIIGAGSRGNAYASALQKCNSPEAICIAAIAEPIESKRLAFERKYVRQDETCRLYVTWQQFVNFELDRRRKEVGNGQDVSGAVDGVFVCVLDEMHAEIITALAPMGLHIMSEKPLATTLGDCLKIYRSLQPSGSASPKAIFSTGHVLRYSPHNMLLRKLLLEQNVIGDVLSIEHTEPVGYWHFSHSYVRCVLQTTRKIIAHFKRGNWRNETTTAPSLLTKSCHDIDLLLWLLCSPPPNSTDPPHLPSDVTSTGSLLYFRKARKPKLAGAATNCLSCPAEPQCIYSAKKIYIERHLAKGNAGWPVNVVDPEIEDLMQYGKGPYDQAMVRLGERLKEDCDANNTPLEEIQARPWFGRCVYESDNDVCDDQVVTIAWKDDPVSSSHDDGTRDRIAGRGAKIATFHMVASTEKQCERRGRIYGTKGEIEYDSKIIRAFDFTTNKAETYYPLQRGGGHGGGDAGLAQQFVNAIQAVKTDEMTVAEAQGIHIGCTLEEIIRSHAMVFAAEDARKAKKVVNWVDWWKANVESAL